MRTSATHPLRIDAVAARPAGAAIGLTFCPGKHQLAGQSGRWHRDLGADLDAIQAWGAGAVVSAIETHELIRLEVSNLGAEVVARNMIWHHVPIRDRDIPGDAADSLWVNEAAPDLNRLLDAGGRVLIHCMGGLGRTGTLACRLLIERGAVPAVALAAVRRARPGTVETAAQERYVLGRRWR